MGKLKDLAFLKSPKVLVPLLILLAIASAVGLAVRNLNAPAVGTVSQKPPDKADIADPYASPGSYSGKYLSFTYPAHYKKVPTQLSGRYLEVTGFFATDRSSKQISVGVLPESINDDSGVKLRRLETTKYKEEPRTASGILIFSSSASGEERTAYVPNGDKVASFSLTSPPGWDLSEDLQTMLTSLRWLQ